MKYLLSLLIVTAMTCEVIEVEGTWTTLYRCENDEVICYLSSRYKYGGGLSCKFKEQSDVAED